MENALRMIIIFVWCMFFGFFSVMGYLDETMTSERKTIILVGLLLILTVYLAFEWFTRSHESGITENMKLATPEEEQPTKDPHSKLDERVLRRLHLYTKDNEQELQAALVSDSPPQRKKPTVSTKKA